MYIVKKGREWFSVDRKTEQASHLLLVDSYNLASCGNDSCQPNSVFYRQISVPGYYVGRENALNKTAIHRLKDMAADSEIPELSQQVQALLGFLVRIDNAIIETKFRV